MQRQVKMIVVACNTASAVALGALKKLPVAVIGVIEPGARAAILASQSMKIGVIGTQATVFSHAYRKAIRRYSRTALIYEVPCPLFVPLVEEGRLEGPVTALAIREYISPILKKKIDTLVLGCTHYPLLKPALKKVVGQRIQLIDSAERTAERVKEALERDKLLNPSPKRGNTSCFVTDHPADFNSLSQRFLGYRLGRAKRFEIESPVG